MKIFNRVFRSHRMCHNLFKLLQRRKWVRRHIWPGPMSLRTISTTLGQRKKPIVLLFTKKSLRSLRLMQNTDHKASSGTLWDTRVTAPQRAVLQSVHGSYKSKTVAKTPQPEPGLCLGQVQAVMMINLAPLLQLSIGCHQRSSPHPKVWKTSSHRQARKTTKITPEDE